MSNASHRQSTLLLFISIAGNDFGADAWPAKAGAAGYIEVWAVLADADDERTLIQVVGAPALPVRPRSVPRLRELSI